MTQHIHEGAARYQPGHNGNNPPAPSAAQAPAAGKEQRSPQQLVTEHIDLWTTAVRHKSTAGRGSGNSKNRKIELAGIKKLRELILELAVRGKLVPQNADDEPAAELLQRIDAEKAQLIKDGKLKKQKPLPPVSEDEKPFELPQGWEWVRLDNVALKSEAGWSPQCLDTARELDSWGVLKVSAVTWAIYNPDENKALPQHLEARPEYEVQDGDFLISRANTSELVARSVVVPNDSPKKLMMSDKIIRFRFSSLVNVDYLNKLNNCELSRTYYLEVAGGTSGSMKNVSRAQIQNLRVPLPPLAEQQRIVAKVDELMALCDELEQQSEHQLDAHQQLTETLLSALLTPAAGAFSQPAAGAPTDSADATTKSSQKEQLNDNWQRLANHFDLLFSGPMGAWAIDRLKDTILQLAVMGKLVPQNPDDEPASVTLNGLALEREKWFKSNQDVNPECRTMQRKLAKLNFPSDATGIPNGWSTAHLIQVTKILVDCHNKTAPYVDNGIPIIRTTNIRNREFVDIDMKYVDQDTYDFWSRRCPPEPDDIIFTREAPMGEAAIIPKGKKFCLGQRTMLIRPMHEYIFNRYLLLALTEPHILERASEKAIGSTVKHLRVGDVENLLIPIPPLVEQHRIVAKVDELFALCDQLKERLQHASDTQLNLTDAIVEQALS